MAPKSESRMKMTAMFSLAAIILGAISAYCWLRSAMARVPHAHAKDDGTFHDATICVDGADFLATAKAQGRWNTVAAFFAALTAFCQVMSALTN